MNKKKITSKEYGVLGNTSSELYRYTLDTDEYLSTLTWNSNVSIYNKMSRSDSQIKAILLMLELPIISTQWFIRPKDNSKKAKKIADFIYEKLFENINQGFDEFLKEACTMFTYGHSIFEKVFKIEKSYIVWKKFASRPQSTIYDFLYDSVGDIQGIQQYLINHGWNIVDIPIEKLLIFTHDKKHGDIKGNSVLRTAYKHWNIKDFLYKTTNIGIERNFVGIPYVKLPDVYTEDDFEQAKAIATTLRSHELAGIVLPGGFELGMFEGKRTVIDALPYVEYQDMLISRSILAQFMNLGSGSGSFALSNDQSQLFLLMLETSAKNIANIINKYAIPELTNYNFNSDLYPKLCFKPLNAGRLVNILKTLTDGKLVIPDKNIEEYIRDMLGLPEKSKDDTQINPKIINPLDTTNITNDDSIKKSDINNNVTGEQSGKIPPQVNRAYKDNIKEKQINQDLNDINIKDEIIKLKKYTLFNDICENILINLNDSIYKNHNGHNVCQNNDYIIKVRYLGELANFINSIDNSLYKSNYIASEIGNYIKYSAIKRFNDTNQFLELSDIV